MYSYLSYGYCNFIGLYTQIVYRPLVSACNYNSVLYHKVIINNNNNINDGCYGYTFSCSDHVLEHLLMPNDLNYKVNFPYRIYNSRITGGCGLTVNNLSSHNFPFTNTS